MKLSVAQRHVLAHAANGRLFNSWRVGGGNDFIVKHGASCMISKAHKSVVESLLRKGLVFIQPCKMGEFSSPVPATDAGRKALEESKT